MPRDQSPGHEACRLRDNGGNRSTGKPGIEHQHQRHRRRDVDEVDRDLHAERQRGARLSDQPAEYDIIGQHQRRGPDPDCEVGFRRAGNPLAAAHRAEQSCCERNLQHDETCADQRRDDKPSHQ
jgi:hypothetical protein